MMKRLISQLLLALCSTLPAFALKIPLVDADEVWSFHKGTNAPQTGWKTIPDTSLDATWTNGLGGFGYADNTAETNQCETLLTDMKGTYTTVYFRKQFAVVSVADTNLHLMLTIDWDDGFIAWLDGVHLTNALVTGAPAEPAYTAISSANHESSHGNNSPQLPATYDFGAVGSRLTLGTHTLAIVGLNEGKTSSDFIQIADLYLAPAPIVSHYDVWRYRKGTNAPQSNWKTVAEASLDSTWASGPGGFGYADNTDETSECLTLLSDMKTNYATVYIRKDFNVGSVDTNLHVMLTMDWDDGFIAWLDGNYLISEFVATAPAEPAYNARAITDHESSRGGSGAVPPTTYDLGAVGTRLAPGTHTLAILGLNDSSSSSDFIQIADLSIEAAPVTPPSTTNFPPGWRFVLFGDTRGNSSSYPVNTQILNELARAATNERAAFVLFSGDLIYDGNLGLPAFQIWTNAISPLYQAGTPYYPLIGNHDAQGSGETIFTNLFAPILPANGPMGEVFRTYFFTYSNALILGLDNYVVSGSVNQPWVDSVLATNRLPHIFTMGHISAFQVTTDHRSMAEVSTPAKRDTFWNSLKNAGAKTYFCGHYHFYDHARFDEDGDPDNDLHQFVVGAGGAPAMTDPPDYPGSNSVWTPYNIYHDVDYGYALINVDGPTVTVTWKHRAGPGIYEAGGDSFIFNSPRVPLLKLSRNGGSTWTLACKQLTPGTTNYLESAAALTNSTWQVVTNFVSTTNTCTLPLSTTNGVATRFYRLRTL